MPGRRKEGPRQRPTEGDCNNWAEIEQLFRLIFFAANKRRFDAGGWGDYANAVAGKVGAVLFAGCVAGVEGEGEDVETGMCAKIAITNEHK